MKLSLKPHHLKRYKDIAMLFVKYGTTDLAKEFAHETAGDEKALLVAKPGQPAPEELADDLEKMGPTFIKFGQLLSSRADLLPEPYLKALARLQDKVKPFPYTIMKIIFPLLALLVAGVLTGCQSPKAASPVENIASQATRNNCYSLLHQLLDDEKGVSLLRFIKPEQTGLKKLVNRIAKTSGTGAALLEKFAKDDPSINLDDIRLPPGETATRDAIASTKEKELLTQTGPKFELALLLTQTEALNYGWHLAQVAAANEPQPDRARALKGISEDMQNLYQEVFARLLVKTTFAATNSVPAETNSPALSPVQTP